MKRAYKSDDFMQPSAGEPIRSVILETSRSVIVAWHVEPGQTIQPHKHPMGEDIWTILSGCGSYQFDSSGNTVEIRKGDVVVASDGDVHGVTCMGSEPLKFVSVVTPVEAGYIPLTHS